MPAPAGSLVLTRCQLVLPTAIASETTLRVERGRITTIGATDLAGAERLDLAGLTVFPGFIDLHIHGAGGHDAHAGAIDAIATYVPRVGVTAFLPTLAAGPPQRTARALRAIAAAQRRQEDRGAPPSAHVLGAHLEGPFLQPARAGAIPVEYFLPAEMDSAERLMAIAPGVVRLMTIAPDIPGALELIAVLAKRGIIASLGHSAVDYELAMRAVAAGASHVTHLFNAMNGLHHRAPGLIGAALNDPRLTLELIADGIHIHPAVLALAIRAKGVQGVALVSDAVGPAGLPAGSYDWLGSEVVSDGRAVRLPDGTLAGSLGTLDVAVRTVTREVGCTLVEAAQMAASVPARILGLAHKGVIAPGYDADLTALDAAGVVRLTIIGGRIAYDNR